MGCMFAGKSTELIRRINKFRIIGKRVICVKFEADMRFSLMDIVTHDEDKMQAIALLKLKDLQNKVDWKENADVIAIDEG
eukprot:CAMPEP_0116874862 /NCGR_PEP_ID=MMETSP0463-20121206/6461_1 /TAXON_ID=181622 /ORGANISM="Strombidinopsis sp, Strain SopsisLIS2011" /LENGTH=79 /DNA_ID=CAMNT_0004519205 /DNA_START=82 /DNA_END=321 /DNA_ORIENTATION=+